MKKYISLALILLLSVTSMQAQVFTKSKTRKMGQSIKNGVEDVLETIKQDEHPTGEHEQWDAYVGPRLGLGLSSLPGAGGRPEVGIVAGGFIEVFVLKNLSVSMELLYQHQGANHIGYTYAETDANGNATGQTYTDRYDYNLGYINTNYLVHWYPWPYRALSLFTGLQLSRLVSANSKLKGGDKVGIKDELHKGEFNIPIGIGYEWKQWQLDARYFISPRKLARTNKAKSIIGNARNMMFSVTIAYKIRLF